MKFEEVVRNMRSEGIRLTHSEHNAELARVFYTAYLEQKLSMVKRLIGGTSFEVKEKNSTSITGTGRRGSMKKILMLSIIVIVMMSSSGCLRVRHITRVDPELKPERPELLKLDPEGMTEENRRLYYKNLERICPRGRDSF